MAPPALNWYQTAHCEGPMGSALSDQTAPAPTMSGAQVYNAANSSKGGFIESWWQLNARKDWLAGGFFWSECGANQPAPCFEFTWTRDRSP